MIRYRNKKPSKGQRKDDLHIDEPTFYRNDKKAIKKWNWLGQPISSGTVLFHTCYKYFAIFTFVDGNTPYFVNINGNIDGIMIDNKPHMFRLATDNESQKFISELKAKGYEFKNNKLYHRRKLINYSTYPFSIYGVHRKNHKRYNKRIFYGGREY